MGPDGALHVPETAAGRITRVDPRTAARRVFADGLPKAVIGLGGAMDVAFRGRTAYVLVTLVSPDVGGSGVDGVYRVDGPHTFTVVYLARAGPLPHLPQDGSTACRRVSGRSVAQPGRRPTRTPARC